MEKTKYRNATGDEPTVNQTTGAFAFKRIAIGILIAIGGIFLIDSFFKHFKKA